MMMMKMKNVVLILILQSLYASVLTETRKYGYEVDEYDFGLFKEVNESDESGNHRSYPPANVITSELYPGFKQSFKRANTKSFTLTINLQQSMIIKFVIIKFPKDKLGVIDRIKLKKENGVLHLIKRSWKNDYKYDYRCFGISAQYVIIEVKEPKIFSHISRVVVVSQRLDLIRQRLLVESVTEAMHPFSNYNDLNIVGFQLTKFTPLIPSHSFDFMVSDNSPMAWFLLQLHSPSYVLTYITSCTDHFPDTFIAYAIDENRELEIYMEDNKVKIFTATICDFMYHNLKYPFVARYIQIYMLYASPNFASRIDFRGFVANPLPKVHNTIHIHSIIKSEIEVSINLQNMYKISGIKFNRADVLEKFCLKYKSKSDDITDYKDNILSSEATVFLGNMVIDLFKLRTFIASEIILSCLKWNEIGLLLSQLTVSVQGEDFKLASHRWITSRKLFDEENISSLFYVFPDTGSDLSLYGNMKNLVKAAPNERLRSDFLGPDCLTRPWLCEYGFTIAFQIYGQLDANLNWDKRILTAYQHVNVLWKVNFQFHSQDNANVNFKITDVKYGAFMHTTLIKYQPSVMSSYADIKSCLLFIPLDSPSQKTFQVSIIVGFGYGNLRLYAQNSSAWTHDYTLNQNDVSINFDLTAKVNALFRVLKKGRKFVGFAVMVGVSPILNEKSGHAIKLNWKKSLLSFQRRIKVPKKIELQENFEWNDAEKSKRFFKPVVVSGLETNLELNQELKFDSIEARASVGKRLWEAGLKDTFQGEKLYRPIGDPVAVSKLQLYDTVSKENLWYMKDAKIYGADLDFDGEEIFPIISCGIHGNDTVNQGTGFSMFYTSKELFGVVKTENKQYTIKVLLSHLQQNQWNSVILRWNKDDMKLNVNNEPEKITYPIDLKNLTKPIYENEYLLLFGQYHYHETYTYGQFRKFSIWRYPLDNDQVNTFRDKKTGKIGVYVLLFFIQHQDLLKSLITNNNCFGQTSFESDNLNFMLVDQFQNCKSKIKFLLKTVFKLNMSDAKMKVKMQENLKDQGIIAYAHEGEASVWRFSYPLFTKCIHFTYRFEGMGFSYVSINDVLFQERFEMARIYLNENFGIENKIEYKTNGSFDEIEVMVMKNMEGDGYFLLSKLEFSLNDCSSNAANSVQELDNEFDKNISAVLEKTGVLSVGLSYLTPDYFSTFPSSHFMVFPLQNVYYHSAPNQHFVIKTKTDVATMVFWYFHKSSSTGNMLQLNAKIGDIENLRMVKEDDKLKFFIRGSFNADITLALDEWHFMELFFENTNLLMIKSKDVAVRFSNTYIIYLHGVDTNVRLHTDYIVCFQYYYKTLLPKELKQSKLCLSEHSVRACPDGPKQCAVCNQMRGTWMLKDYKSHLLNFDCNHISKDIQMDFYYSFDDVVDNSFYDITVMHNISIVPGHVGLDNNGIVSGAVMFTNDNNHVILDDKCSSFRCFVASWIKHRCISNTTLLSGTEFALKCSSYEHTTNYAHMVLETRSCSYYFHGKGGLWYHLIIAINGRDVSIQVDGVQVEKDENCDITHQSSRSQLFVSTKTDEWVYMDELAMNTDNPFSFPLVNMTSKHFMNRAFPTQKFPNYWVEFTLQNIEWNKNYTIRGHKKQEFLLRLINKTLTDIYFINEMSIDRDKLYISQKDAKFIVKSLITINPKDYEILIRESFNEGIIGDVKSPSIGKTRYEISMGKIRTDSTTIEVKIDKTFMIFRWTEPASNSVPLKGLFITAMHDQLGVNNETSYDIDSVTISGLRGYNEYEICIAAIPLLSDFPEYSSTKCFGKFRTLEAEPFEEPALNCSISSETQITCIVYNISIDSFAGVPHSYHLYSVETNQMNETHLDVNEWNLENFTKDVENYVVDHTEYIFVIETLTPYELYTIVTMATTQDGYGLGVRNNITIRSHEGAPGEMPVLLSLQATNRGSLIIEWESLPEDEEEWNSANKKNWLYEVSVQYYQITDLDSPINTTRINISSQVNQIDLFIYQTWRLWLLHHVYHVSVSAKNEFGKSDVNNSFCVLFPGLRPGLLSKFSLDLHPLPNSKSWNITTGDFHPNIWRGKRSYLFFAQAVNHSAYTIDNITDMVKENGCYSVSINYWLKIFCKPFNLTKTVDRYIGSGEVCNNTDFKEFSEQEVVKTFTLDNFHPHTFYLLYVFACNDIGCRKKPSSSEYFQTIEYKPGAGPENITVTAISSTALNLTFGVIESFYQHGVLQGYHINLLCTSLNMSRFINETTNVTVTIFEDLEKYENCCVIIAGFTSYPGLGNYSDPVCNRTLDDIPDKSPTNIWLNNMKSREVVVRWGRLDQQDWNGIPLHFILNYTCYLRNNSIEEHQYEINYDKVRYKLRNLYPDTTCEFFLSSCTQVGCNTSNIMNFTSNEDVPTACPVNFTLINKTSTCLTFSWDEIEIMDQNGIIQGYHVVLQDGTSAVKQINVTNRNVTFCNLIKFYEYDVSIGGITSAGIGESCTLTQLTDEDLPCAPSNITVTSYYTDYLIVEWEDVPVNCQNGNILGFVIFYYEVIKNEAISPPVKVFVKDKVSRRKNIGNVTAGNTYNVSVAAYTIKGIGEVTEEKQKQLGVRVNGNWTDWTNWKPCSASCGPAFKLRTRDCINPVPKNGGLNCSGETYETKDCNHAPCSGYIVAPPGQYDCNEFCETERMLCNPYMDTNFNVILKDIKVDCGDNKGDKNYLETKHPGIMDNGSNKKKCVGYENAPNETLCTLQNNPKEEQYQRICHCIHQNDVGYSPWGEWSMCTITCGDSQLATRSRICSKEKCMGPPEQSRNCNVPPCPVDGNWGEWTDYEDCNKTCGYGYENRRRFCDKPTPRYGGRNCSGPRLDWKAGCNFHLCPVDGKWGQWSDWSGFKKPCGNSTQNRYRYCDKPAPDHNGRFCKGNKTDISIWKRHPCRENNVFIILTFDKMRFVYTMNYLNHPDTLELAKYICDMLLSISFNTTSVYDCKVIMFRKGSVIAHVSATFENVDAEQLVHISDVLTETKMYGKESLKSFNINTTTVPCPPPSNIQVEEKSGGTVNISFKIEQCYDGKMPFEIYVFYIDNKLSSQLDTWKWTGIFGNGSSYIVINNLNPMVKYRARLVESSELGNGIPSGAIYFSSPAGPPLSQPPNLRHISMSATNIFIEWTDLPVIYRNGELLGYKVMYKQYFHTKYMEKTISFGFKNTILEDLKPFTWYIILVCAYNRGGNGPTDYSVVQTLEGVPSIPVPNLIVSDMLALDWWFVTWSQIPDEYVNGELIGYRLKYYLSYRSGQPIAGEKNEAKYDFDIYTFRHEERDLLSYATYNVTVTGFTKSGEGPTPEYYAKTCNCPKLLFGNWYINPPYTQLENDELGGIFPEMIKDMIIESCGGCHDYQRSEVYFMTSKTPFNPNTGTELHLKRRISDKVDVSFPLYGRKEIEAIVPDSVFISIISSPGCALIIRNETNVEGILNNMIMGVLSVWPMLLVSYAIATLFGILVWFTDQTENPEEFNLGSSLRGPCIGFWFSFVTMTTVGYGDITPRSILAKSISMVWFLTGLVLNGIVVGFITSAVTSINVVEEHSLYNTLTGTVNNTFEQRYAVMRNAKMEDTYTTVDDVLDALSNSKVDAALIDIYSMASYKPILKKKQLKVVSLIDARTGYGLALSGMAQVLKPDIESLVIQKQNIIGEFVSSLEDSIPELTLEEAGSASADIFSPTSPAFITSCLYMGILIGCLSIIGIIVDRVLWLRKRKRIEVAKSRYDEIGDFAEELLTLCYRAEELIKERNADNARELAQLALHRRSYSNKIESIGRERAEQIVKESHVKKGISEFSSSYKK